MTRVVALTGNIAAGKSAVVEILNGRGIPIIEADAIVHELQQPGTGVYHAIIDRFGTDIVQANGELDRASLRRIILDDDLARKDLEAILHPEVFAIRNDLLEEMAELGHDMIVVDIPLLYEADNPTDYDAVVLVDAPVAERRRRLIELRGITPADADRLIAIQMPADRKRDLADVVIDNDGGLELLRERTEAAFDSLLE